MHIHFLDPYIERGSLIHRLDPRLKLIVTLAFILTSALTPIGAWPVYILLFAIVLAAEVLSEIGVGYLQKRAILAFPFVLAALPLIFTVHGEQILKIPIGPWELNASLAGLERFVSIAIKSWISVQAALLLATTTPFPDLLMAMRQIHIPPLLISIFSLMWRYLFVLADEALRLIRARKSRSGEGEHPELKPGGSLVWRAKITGGMAGSLFLRAFERSDRIYQAMLARGYDGEVRHRPFPTMPTMSMWILILSLLFLFILLLFGLLFYG